MLNLAKILLKDYRYSMEMSGENSHGEELNLDAEWAEFNASLDESRDMEFLRDKLVLDQIKEDMLAKVVESGVDTLVHYTDDEEARIYSDYFETRLNELMGGYADMSHDTPSGRCGVQDFDRVF